MFRPSYLAILILAAGALPAVADTTDQPRLGPGIANQVEAAPSAGAGLGLTLNHSDGVYRKGDFLRATFRAPADCYVYVFYHQADKTAVLLYPNLRHTDHHVRAGQVINAPGVNDRIQCRIAGPYGREAVQVITSTAPIPYFEDALRTVKGVPVLASTQVDAVCLEAANHGGMQAEFLPLETRDSEPQKRSE